MLINKDALLDAAPIKNMEEKKVRGVTTTSYGLAESGYDIRTKQSIYFDPKNNKVTRWQDGVKEEFPNTQYVLISSLECFQMPSFLSGLVMNKSTWVRRGLNLPTVVIEPSWNGYLTLGLSYHGTEPLTIPAGSGIAQVLFLTLSNPVDVYDGKYQDSKDEITHAREG